MFLRRFAFAALVLGLFGCSYSAERDETVTRLVEDDAVCPSADSIGADELKEWRTVEVGALCYYEILAGDDGKPFRCYSPRPSFEAIQADAKATFAPNPTTGEPSDVASTAMCTAAGHVFIVPADGATCPAEAPQQFGWKMGGLVATDARTPYRFCTYDATYEYEKHPFSCGRIPGLAPE